MKAVALLAAGQIRELPPTSCPKPATRSRAEAEGPTGEQAVPHLQSRWHVWR
jgi:hypothetical protein